MKIIIAYASAGAGHQKAAEAIYNRMRQLYPQARVTNVDLLEDADSFFRFCYNFGYSLLVRHAIYVWGFLFWLTARGPLTRISRFFSFYANWAHTKPFQELLIKENPDAVISTHFATAEMAAYLKKKGRISSRLVTVITDYGVHPFWLSPGTDLYIGASEFTRDKLIAMGVEEDKIRVLGIPIDAKFLRPFDRERIRLKFGVPKDAFCVMIMTGSFGVGPIEKIVGLLDKDVRLLVVCANNKELYSRLAKKNGLQAKIFGFVDNAEELMAASDMIITKPGGLTISEALSLDLALLFIFAIPGQEHGNAEALQELGVGMELRRPREVRRAVLEMRDHPEKLRSIREKIRDIRRPQAAEEICRAVCESSGRASG